VKARDLEAVVAVAEERHFGRAASRLQMSAPNLSELVRRVERDLGASLFDRTSRSVSVTAAGEVFVAKAIGILDEFAALRAAVRDVSAGEAGTLRLGVTPPAGRSLLPCLLRHFTTQAPLISVEVQKLWRPNLAAALNEGSIDAAIVFGAVEEGEGTRGRVLWNQRLVVGVRSEHRFSLRASIALSELSGETLGLASPDLFPAWAQIQREALGAAGVVTRTLVLDDPNLEAPNWTRQTELDCILLVPSLALPGQAPWTTVAIDPTHLVPFSLEWQADSSQAPLIDRFMSLAAEAELPSNWYPGPDAPLKSPGNEPT
jgi:DNA-binding transcriptional LysR family regulator